MKATLFIIAALLLAGQAMAGKKTHDVKQYKSCNGGEAPGTFAAMACTGHAYCFPPVSEPRTQQPGCSKPGYKFDEKSGQCYKRVGWECSTLGSPCKDDPSQCNLCKGNSLINAQGQCEELCKIGYEKVTVYGESWCVKACKDGCKPMGDSCADLSEAKAPKKCEPKACGPFKTLIWTKGAAANNYEQDTRYGAVYKAANSAYSSKDASYASGYGYGYATSDCVCAKATKRDVYQPACNEPKIVDAFPVHDWCPGECKSDGSKPKPFGKCPDTCGADCYWNKDGNCAKKCPAGFKMCSSKKGKDFCATAAPVFGCDSCEFFADMSKHMDDTTMCRNVAPKYAPKSG